MPPVFQKMIHKLHFLQLHSADSRIKAMHVIVPKLGREMGSGLNKSLHVDRTMGLSRDEDRFRING